tara:strand:+ start:596 stop:973 length:378 start_codon:yes stop_codon:yes gene_type:complete
MGILDRFRKDPLAPKRAQFNITTFLILTVMSLVLVQAFGAIFGKALGLEIALGPIFVLISVGATSLISLAIFRKMWAGGQVTKADIATIFIVGGLTLLMLFFLKDLIPSIFEQSILNLQSIVSPQ